MKKPAILSKYKFLFISIYYCIVLNVFISLLSLQLKYWSNGFVKTRTILCIISLYIKLHAKKIMRTITKEEDRMYMADSPLHTGRI